VARILGRLFGVVFAFVIVTGSANAYTLTSPEGHFTAVFPGQPNLQKSSGKTTAGISYNQSTWVFDSGIEAWLVILATFSQTGTKDFAPSISAAVASVKGKLVSQKNIQQNGAAGVEILIDIGPQEGRQRMVWIGNRFYQIIYVGKTGTTSTPTINAFFNSFQATK
jgi:hypothetical protein